MEGQAEALHTEKHLQRSTVKDKDVGATVLFLVNLAFNLSNEKKTVLILLSEVTQLKCTLAAEQSRGSDVHFLCSDIVIFSYRPPYVPEITQRITHFMSYTEETGLSHRFSVLSKDPESV